jgi:hypothetical protein
VQENASKGDRNVGNKSAGQNPSAGQGARSLVVAGITTCPGVSNRAPDMWYNIKEEVSRDIGKMMGIPPLRGRDISNLSSSSTSKINNMSNTSRTSWRNSKT